MNKYFIASGGFIFTVVQEVVSHIRGKGLHSEADVNTLAAKYEVK